MKEDFLGLGLELSMGTILGGILAAAGALALWQAWTARPRGNKDSN